VARRTSNKFIFSVLFDQGLKQLEFQAASVASMEAKTGYLIAGEGVILTILVTFATQAKGFLFNSLIDIGFFLSLVSLLFCILTLWNRHIKIGIGIKDFYTRFLQMSDEQIRLNALNIVNYDYEVNRNILEIKSQCFQTALITFGFSLLFLVGGLLYNYYTWYTTSMAQAHRQSTPSRNQPIRQNNNRNIAQPIGTSYQSQNFHWFSANQNIGTIAADVTKSKHDNTGR